jgi:hypothetical protein
MPKSHLRLLRKPSNSRFSARPDKLKLELQPRFMGGMASGRGVAEYLVGNARAIKNLVQSAWFAVGLELRPVKFRLLLARGVVLNAC